jgi:hypothetical protein
MSLAFAPTSRPPLQTPSFPRSPALQARSSMKTFSLWADTFGALCLQVRLRATSSKASQTIRRTTRTRSPI